MNPHNSKEFKLLVEAVAESRRKLQPFREKRKSLISMFVGDQYSDDGAAKKVYLNLISMATNIYVRQMAVRAPTARIVTPYPELRALANSLEIACKDVARESTLGVVLRRAVTDALFSPMATVKIGLKAAGQKELYGQQIDVTDPFIKLVSFDDYVRDMSSRSAYDPAFEGDSYVLSLPEVLEMYPSAKSLNLTPGEAGMEGEDRAEGISHEQRLGDNDFRKQVQLQDLWLPTEKLLVTYAIQKPDRPLAVVEFDGMIEGPYRSLWFTDVPDNAMPLPPFSVLRNVSDLANRLFRRMSAQAQNQKNIVGFHNEEDALRFDKTHDGHATFWDSQGPDNLQAGGIDPRNMALFMQVKDIFSWSAGNLDSLGGLSPMAETAKQDEMLARSASAQIADMQDATSEFAKEIFRDLAWYEWTDPIRERMIEKKLPGVDISIPVPWTPETRSGNFLDFNFTIIPQSMREDSPAAKVQKLNAVLQQTILPMMPLLEQQGMTVDARRLLGLIGAYTNLPEIEDIVVSVDPEQQQQRQPTGDPNPSVMPAQTKRTYERINRPGATRVGKDKALANVLMGAGVQDADAQSFSMGVG